MDVKALMVPGLWNSGPKHWQSRWEAEHGYVRVQQRDWETPACADWTADLDAALGTDPGSVVLAAHSLGCATVAHWAARCGRVLRGALLVAPSDVEAPSYPDCTTGFQPMPLAPLPFPSIVVASDDDVYVSLERARTFAEAWGSRLVVVKGLGHINSDSDLGSWPFGHELFKELF